MGLEPREIVLELLVLVSTNWAMTRPAWCKRPRNMPWRSASRWCWWSKHWLTSSNRQSIFKDNKPYPWWAEFTLVASIMMWGRTPSNKHFYHLDQSGPLQWVGTHLLENTKDLHLLNLSSQKQLNLLWSRWMEYWFAVETSRSEDLVRCLKPRLV